jgi:DNA repair protein RAD57
LAFGVCNFLVNCSIKFISSFNPLFHSKTGEGIEMDFHLHCSDSSFIVNDPNVENIISSFKHNNISSTELLISSPSSISKRLRKTEPEVLEFVNQVKAEIKDKLQGSLQFPLQNKEEVAETQTYFTFGDNDIDKKFNGGIPVGYLIEVTGKSASGKTNLLLTLCITIQLPREFGGLGPSIFSQGTSYRRPVKSIYLPTESRLATQRLSQVVDNYTELLKTNGISAEETHFFPKLDNVISTKVMSSLDEQDHILRYQVPAMLTRDPDIKLLVIDSLTHHMRAELNWDKRPEYLRSMCAHLKNVSKMFNVTVIVANQVSDKPVKGLFSGDNDLLLKMNTEYQLAWLQGWDDVGILYRQLMRREGVIDEAGKSFERLDYLDDLQKGNFQVSSQEEMSFAATQSQSNDSKFEQQQSSHLRSILRAEKKRLFDGKYKVQVGKIGTRPALGLHLLEFVDMRIVLSRESMPILNENLIDEFSEELGINKSFTQEAVISRNNHSGIFETSTQNTEIENENASSEGKDQKRMVRELSNNHYLQNYNFETIRTIKGVFGPLIPAGETREIGFSIWNGGIRKHSVNQR